ncbi:MAG TPA: FAD-dependent monooxygenase [Polyangiaceae bacterium]|jgi:2-polyprenyl-6-methoxyphenol hydroxylase-like FAD-dependent oxidoreductase|nr:FAD-dependent monooxygenase [Polyangiaceae bacterium]
MTKSDVLIVGAGPTGLVLAIWLTRLGVRVRVVDQASSPGQTSRALAVSPRTLEFYRQMGFASAVVDAGVPLAGGNLWVRGERKAHVDFASMGKGRSPFDHLLVYPQDHHEKLLTEHLAAAGVQVERPVEFVDFDPAASGVSARLRHADGSIETCEADYLAGCDGARSPVRQGLHVDFPGGTYARYFYVADVEASGPTMNGELHIDFEGADFVTCFPMKGGTRARLVGTVRDEVERKEELTWADVDRRIVERLRMQVTRVNWFSTYHVHHRVAAAFRRGRVFLLGDAAHIHSPVGGQGMNTGIGDAVNLAWKLAATLGGHADERILDSYEAERVPFAQRLVRTTDRAFELVTAEGGLARHVRDDVVPPLLAAGFRFPAARRRLFDTVSQIKVEYRASAFNEGREGAVHGGDRLPWVPAEASDNFRALASIDWQVHVYGEAGSDLRQACEARRLALRVFPWTPPAARAGLARDAAYLVRPDGYVGLAASSASAAARLAAYLDARGLRPLAA